MVSFAPTGARNRTLPFVLEELRQLLVGVTDHRPLCSFLPPIPRLLPSLPTLATACAHCGLQCAVWHLSEGGFPGHGQEPVWRTRLLLEATTLLPARTSITPEPFQQQLPSRAIPTTQASRALKTSLRPCVFYTAPHAHTSCPACFPCLDPVWLPTLGLLWRSAGGQPRQERGEERG